MKKDIASELLNVLDRLNRLATFDDFVMLKEVLDKHKNRFYS